MGEFQARGRRYFHPTMQMKEGDQQEIIPMGIPTLLAHKQSSCSSRVVQMGRYLHLPLSP